ncbi:MAG: DUF2871 domain-containing protein [Oscillospiraceae bacterium]
MCKKYVNSAFIYAIVAMVFGVFYREFTKFTGFGGATNLSVMHTHYFMLGMFFFLILALLEKSFSFSENKNTSKIVAFYHIGLNIAGLGLFVRGMVQVLCSEISSGLDASISGISGVGHIILGVSLILLLVAVKKSAAKE